MPAIADISPDQLDELIASGCAVIDIRGSEDFAEGHIPGAANVPATNLKADPGQIAHLLSDGVSPALALVCTRGHTSRRIAEDIADAPEFSAVRGLDGLDVIHSLDGGTVAWERSGRTVATEN